MSKAEDLLDEVYSANAILSLANESEEAHIVIGDDRRITVPSELKRLAVQHDHNVETVTFDCPRYWDEHDMSTMNVYINYLRVDKEVGVFKAENVAVDADDSSIMHFDWTISRNVTEVNGNLTFIVCVKNTDADGVERNHWNSELCRECYISEGLEMDGEIFTELYTDVIEQWYKDVLESINSIESVKDNLIGLRDSGSFDGATFIPSINENSEISWTNDKGRPNPPTKNIQGLPGVSPVIQITDINGGHRVTITDVEGTKSFDVLDTIINQTDAVTELLNRSIYVGGEEPTSGPALWFNTDVPYDVDYNPSVGVSEDANGKIIVTV